MGVIAVLAAVLFPTIAQARGSQKQMSSLSAMIRLGTAQSMYAQDYDTDLTIRERGFMPSGSDACMAVDPSGNWQSVEGGCKDSSSHLVWSNSARFTSGHAY